MKEALCLCGQRVITFDGLCKECMFIGEQLQRELKWKRKYDGRSRKKAA